MSGYDAAFYATVRPGAITSAQVIAPLVLGHVDAKTIIDVGCGEGWFAHAFHQLGCDTLGIDGAVIDTRPAGPRFAHHDLTTSFADLGRYDLAVCLEVAEHLPASRADGLVADLTTVADVVLFSAAIPGQGGVGHVNEQWPAYWEELFRARGWSMSGALRWPLWTNMNVENWYRANLAICARTPEAYPDLFYSPLTPMWPVVHPILFQHRTGT